MYREKNQIHYGRTACLPNAQSYRVAQFFRPAANAKPYRGNPPGRQYRKSQKQSLR